MPEYITLRQAQRMMNLPYSELEEEDKPFNVDEKAIGIYRWNVFFADGGKYVTGSG